MSVATTTLAQRVRWAPQAMRVHPVGSPPIGAGADPLSTMQWHADNRHGAVMDALPFDIDDRWLVGWLHARKHIPGLVPVGARAGIDRHDLPYYSIADGHELKPDDLTLGLSRLAEAAFAAHEYVVGDDVPDRLQVSVPNALDLAFFVSGSIEAAEKWMPTMQAVVAAEVAGLSDRWGRRARLQLESPAILLAYYHTQIQDWPLLSSELVQQVTGILHAAPEADWVLHVCSALVDQVDIAAAVSFLNSLADLLTDLGQPMPTVHLPISSRDVPPSTDPEFYSALRQLRRGIDIVAGVVTECYPDQTHAAVGLIVDALGGPLVGVGAECGLRDRSIKAGVANAALASCVAREWTSSRNR
jgi:hypothetical protein